jgi:hypothetical protein
VASTPYEQQAGSAVALHRVQVDVAWGDGTRAKDFSLVSLRPQQTAREAPAAR